MRSHRAHVRAETLARLNEGLLGERRATRIRAHLARCDRCAGVHHRLGGVTALLAATPQPAMPEALARRLGDALAAAATARAGSAVAPNGHGERVTAHDAEGRPGERGLATDRRAPTWWPARAIGATFGGGDRGALASRRERPGGRGAGSRAGWRGVAALPGLAAAAAVCLLAAGGYALSQLPSLSSTSSSGSSAASARKAASGAAAGGVRIAHSSGAEVHPYAKAPGSSAPFPVFHTGTNYQPADLGRQAQTDVDKLVGVESGTVSGLRIGAPTHALVNCVDRFTDHAILVDVARYRGRPADVIVFASMGTLPGQAWVVTDQCSTLAHVGLPVTGPRPAASH